MATPHILSLIHIYRPEQAARVFAVLCELRPEPEDEIAEVLLNNTYTLFNVP